MNITSDILTRISLFVRHLLPEKRPLTISENKQLVTFAKHYASNIRNKMDKSEFVLKTSLEYFTALTNKPAIAPVYQDIDTHEMLKDIITDNIDPNELGSKDLSIIKQEQVRKEITSNIIKIANIKSLKAFAQLFNPTATYKKGYVTLDSSYAIFNDDNTKLKWDYISVRQESDTSTNTINRIRDIVSMRIYSIVLEKFTITQERATIFIHEFDSQCFVTPSGFKFHTVALLNDLETPVGMDTRNAVGTPIGYTEDWLTNRKYELLMGYRFNEGTYNFHTPITTFNSLTLSVGNPLSYISIPKHKITGVIATTIDYVGNSIVLVTPEPHYLTGNIYSIRCEGFTTDDPVTDADLITFMNGNEFTSATVTNSTTITISPKNIKQIGVTPLSIEYTTSVSLTLTGTPQPFTIYLDGYRIIINIEFTYKDPTINN